MGGTVSARQDLAREMRELRVRCGNPSYARLYKISLMLPPATVSGVLNAKTSPRLDFVLSFVRACLEHADAVGVVVPADQGDLEHWRDLWQRLHVDGQGQRRGVAEEQSADGRPTVLDVVPWQLPGASSLLVGRDDDLAWLDDQLGDGRPSLLHLHGDSGAGKTSLVLAWAHRRRQSFVDGQLYADFARAGHGRTATALEILLDFMIALGYAAADLPTEVTGLSGMFRTALVQRATLVVLDNVVDEEDIAHFSPGDGPSRVVAISGPRLTGLVVRHGAADRRLGALEPSAAADLLMHVVPDLDSAEAAKAAAACEYHPLRLRILGDQLVHTPRARALVATLAAAPAGAPRLDRLLEWSVQGSTRAETRALYLLAHHPGALFDPLEAAAVVDTTQGGAQGLIAGLTSRYLLMTVRPGRSALHPLVRDWAAEAATTSLPGEDRDAARRRLWGYYLWTVDAADRMLLPQRGRPALVSALPHPAAAPRFTTEAEAIAWCAESLPNMAATVEAAVGYRHALAHQLPHVLMSYFNLRKPWPLWIQMCRSGSKVAEELGDPESVGNLNISLGIALRETREEDQAVAAFEHAQAMFAVGGNRMGGAMALNNLATIHNHRHEPDAAIVALRQALTLLEETEDEFRVSIVSHNLAEAELLAGRNDEAREHANLAYEAALGIGDLDGAAITLVTLARAKDRLDDWRGASADYQRALEMQQQAGDRFAQIAAHDRLGELLDRRVGPGAGDEHRRTARQIESELG